MCRANVGDSNLASFDGIGLRFRFDGIMVEKIFNGLASFRIARSAVKDFSLKPLKIGGLWLAVIITPPMAFRFFTANETEGVGVGSGVRTT